MGDDKEYCELRRNVRATQAAKEILQQMLASATEEVKKLKDKFNDWANKRKFCTLSDDILAIIFEMTCRDPTGSQVMTVNNLSLVSRRFRSIVLGLPMLWSNISCPALSIATAKLFASRIATPSISLSISGADAYFSPPNLSKLVRVLSAFQFAVSISSRIRILSIDL